MTFMRATRRRIAAPREYLPYYSGRISFPTLFILPARRKPVKPVVAALDPPGSPAGTRPERRFFPNARSLPCPPEDFFHLLSRRHDQPAANRLPPMRPPKKQETGTDTANSCGARCAFTCRFIRFVRGIPRGKRSGSPGIASKATGASCRRSRWRPLCRRPRRRVSSHPRGPGGIQLPRTTFISRGIRGRSGRRRTRISPRISQRSAHPSPAAASYYFV